MVLAHGTLDEDSQEEAILAMREHRAQILIGTTVIEVGVNLPNLRRALVVDAGSFGAVTPHQIRGRLAREGGSGEFDMLVTHAGRDQTLERLRILVEHTDGLSVAEADMRIRGFGELARNGTKQSGADETVFFGRALSPVVLESVLAWAEGGKGA